MIERFESLRLELTTTWPQEVAGAGMNAIAMIEHRITTEGKEPGGGALKPYTRPYQKFKEAPQNTKRGRELGLGSSRFSGKTDYMLTGAFWRDIQVRSLVVQSADTLVTIGPKAPVNIAIMESLTKRDGFPLRLSEEEEKHIADQMEANLIQLVDKYFPIND
jgi:hypothetical protein